MYVARGDNPTQMYLQSWEDLNEYGSLVTPRGKKILEMRPACFEFENPSNRVTFVPSRRINPFFQIAESLWILSGCSDVKWLEKFNSTIGQFSDNGKYFNAPYGERMRSWNKNDAHEVIINPIDQLYDAYTKILHDRDTRQAVVVLYNPMFDNHQYTIGEKGKDIACLTGDTIISSPEGDLPIKDIVELVQQGKAYSVYSYNVDTQTVEIKPVKAGAMTRKDAQIIKITMRDGTILKVTPDHTMYIILPNYRNLPNYRKLSDSVFNIDFKYELVEATKLKVGDYLPILDSDMGKHVTSSTYDNKIQAIEYLSELEDVYDLMIKDNHNFFANNYLVHNCNLVFTFKVRDSKLDMTVFNRSNDLHWGLFGANLCQFSTIQEVLCSWLRHEEGFKDLELGTYTHITDSLHMYLEDYGAKSIPRIPPVCKEVFTYENFQNPEMNMSLEQFHAFLKIYWSVLNEFVMNDAFLQDDTDRNTVFGSQGLLIDCFKQQSVDDYWYFAIQSMVVYRLAKLGKLDAALDILSELQNCQWKISMLYFLKNFVKKSQKESADYEEIEKLYQGIVSSLIYRANLSDKEFLTDYLTLLA